MKKKETFQSYYKPLVGSAFLDRDTVVAGSATDLKLTYRVGMHGIDETGMIKVLFRIASDMGSAQFSDPNSKNYVHVTSSNKNVDFVLVNSMSQKLGKQDVRPWSRGFAISVMKSDLVEGDEVFIHFSKFSIQTYTEKNFEFRLRIDSFATGKMIEIEDSPKLIIIPDKPEKICIILPSAIEPDKQFKVFAKVEDKFRNVCTNYSGTLKLEALNDTLMMPKEVALSAGVGEVEVMMSREGVCVISGSLEGLRADSNPSICTARQAPTYLWADLQGQSEETVGTNSIENYFEFAKKYGRLDITSHQGNDFQITNAFWDKINRLTDTCNEDGSFVALPGYEWSGNSSVGGDHNVIFYKEGQQIHRSSHALVDDLSDVDTDASTVEELCKKVDRKNTVLIAHAGGRYANLEKHSSSTFPDLIEIHSDWGTFEWLLRNAFDLDMIVGIVANSDGHKGTPGASYPGSLHFGSQGGLTCVRARSLTRKDVFQALKSRHTYGTTGARILLDVACVDASGKMLAEAGDILTVSEDTVKLSVNTITAAPLERVEIYKKNTLLKTFYSERDDEKSGKLVKLLYSGASGKGRSRAIKWNGSVVVSNNTIEELEKINFYSDFDSVQKMDNKIDIQGTTTGGVQGIIMRLRDKIGSLRIRLNDKELLIDVEDITNNVKEYDFGALDAKLEVYETTSPTGSQIGKYEIILNALSETNTPYFVKTIQRDGHMAWSSPIYISCQK